MRMDELESWGKRLDRAAEDALTHAKARQADGALVSSSVAYERRLVVENKEFSLANTLSSQSLSILVHKDQKKGSASLNVDQKEAVHRAVDDALALASYSVPDPYLTLAKANQAPEAKPLPFLVDAKLLDYSMEQMQGAMNDLLQILCSDKRIALDRFEMSLRATRQSFFNTNGVKQSESQTMLGWNFVGMAVEGEEVSGMDYDGASSYDLAHFMPRAKVQITEFKERLIRSLRPKACPSYNGLVIFGPRAFKSLLLNTVMFQMAGRSVMDQKSKWAEKVGQQVASKLLTFRDLPHRADFGGASSYDGDGLPTRDNTFVREGILNQLNCDLYSGKRLSLPSCHLSGGPFGLSVSPGKTPISELLNTRNEILYVDRFSGNGDPVTGDFSGVAKSSALYRSGKWAWNTSETMIAGNSLDLLMKIQAMEDKAHILSASFEAPAVLVDGVSVTGSVP